MAVASGKGGVGKTWLAITLAHSLAQAGQRVLLIDGDLGLANVDVQLGLTPRADLVAIATGERSLSQAVTSHRGGFDLIAGRSGHAGLAGADDAFVVGLLNGLRVASRIYERMVLDLPAGLDRTARRLALFADTLLVVATDEPTSLTDAYAVLKLYARDRRDQGNDGAAQIVVNQATSLQSGRRTYETLARACQTFLGAAPGLAGVIRRDRLVPAAIRRQAPLLETAPHGPAAEDVRTLASRL